MRLDAGDCDDAVSMVHDLEVHDIFRDALRRQPFGSQERLHGRQVGGGRDGTEDGRLKAHGGRGTTHD
jgi:hypothetical protein